MIIAELITQRIVILKKQKRIKSMKENGVNSMDSIMGLILRIGALIIFSLCLIGCVLEAQITNYLITGWCALICANLEDIKEILKYDRKSKPDRDRDGGAN